MIVNDKFGLLFTWYIVYTLLTVGDSTKPSKKTAFYPQEDRIRIQDFLKTGFYPQEDRIRIQDF